MTQNLRAMPERRPGRYERGDPRPPRDPQWDGMRIREMRLRTGLTVSQLADRVGMSPTSLSDTELNHSMPNIATVIRIAKALGVSMSTLVGEHHEGEEFHAGYTAALLDMQDSLHKLRRAHEGD